MCTVLFLYDDVLGKTDDILFLWRQMWSIYAKYYKIHSTYWLFFIGNKLFFMSFQCYLSEATYTILLNTVPWSSASAHVRLLVIPLITCFSPHLHLSVLLIPAPFFLLFISNADFQALLTLFSFINEPWFIMFILRTIYEQMVFTPASNFCCVLAFFHTARLLDLNF